MPCRRRVPVESSTIQVLGYDPESQVLEIVFRSTPDQVYRYSNVEPELFCELLNAPSVGEFFHDEIRDNDDHPFEKVALVEPG